MGCEIWTIKNVECQRIDAFESMLEKTPQSPLDSKEIKPVNFKGNQPWIFIGRTDAEAPVLWPPDAKSWLFEKDSDTEKGMTEDEMVGWHHQLNGHEFEQTLGVGDGQGGLVCCSPWGHRVGQTWATGQQYIYVCHICSHITDLLDQPHSVIWLICGVKWSSFKSNEKLSNSNKNYIFSRLNINKSAFTMFPHPTIYVFHLLRTFLHFSIKLFTLFKSISM